MPEFELLRDQARDIKDHVLAHLDVYLEKFELETITNNLPYATVLMGVPTYYSRLLESKKLTKLLVKNPTR